MSDVEFGYRSPNAHRCRCGNLKTVGAKTCRECRIAEVTRPTRELEEKARALKAAGMTNPEIAIELEVPAPRVAALLRDAQGPAPRETRVRKR